MVLRPRLVTRFLCVFALLLAGGLVAAAADDAPGSDPVGQGTGPSGSVEPATGDTQGGTESPAPVVEDKRVFGVLPNYRTTELTPIYTPITAKQKMIIATKDTIDYPLFLLGGALAGLAK